MEKHINAWKANINMNFHFLLVFAFIFTRIDALATVLSYVYIHTSICFLPSALGCHLVCWYSLLEYLRHQVGHKSA